ncbi:Uncharacterized protein RNJ44_01336 [Nakaseomyces bracarensis]|uniref:Uncharacterized protein n=1 Tax=Nakaseomyces bracarensis TaxID=273131 RepID=A0ABR4NPF4_9SACH
MSKKKKSGKNSKGTTEKIDSQVVQEYDAEVDADSTVRGVIRAMRDMDVAGSEQDELAEEMKKLMERAEELFVSDITDVCLFEQRNKYRDMTLAELVTLVFLTTKGGKRVVELLTDWNYEDMRPYKNVYVTDTRGYRALTKQWSTDIKLLCLLLQYLLSNESLNFEISRFADPKYKMALKEFLPSGSSTLTNKLLLDPGFNLMVEYLQYSQIIIRSLLLNTLEKSEDNATPTAKEAVRIIRDSNRVVEFNGSYLRYCAPFHSVGTSELQTANPIFNFVTKFCNFPRPVNQGLSVLRRLNTIKEISDAIEIDNYKWLYGGANELPYKKDIVDDEIVYSFELDQNGIYENKNVMKITELRHEILFRYLNLDKPNILSTDLEIHFKLLAGLVDPLTQPSPTDSQIISIDQVYLIFLGLYRSITILHKPIVKTEDKFMMCMNLMKIVKMTTVKLLCDDYEKLQDIENFEDSEDWKKTIDRWVPKDLNTQDLELLYMIDILCVYAIYKTYENQPLGKNPFLFDLYYLWKCLSKIVFLGLQIDRLEEAESTFETPLLVRATVRGCSALRSVLATILNERVDINEHDFKHESFNTFMSPHGRKLCNGALISDMRTVIKSFIESGIELDDITNLLVDLTPGDRFDEDIEYMFDYEYEDYNVVSDTEDEDISGEDEEDKNNTTEIHRRCNCVFEDDKIIENSDKLSLEDKSDNSKRNDVTKLKFSSTPDPFAVRARSFFDFNYGGKDWRDIPRGENLYYNPDYVFLGNVHKDTFVKFFERATTTKLETGTANVLLLCVASCIKEEQDYMIIHYLPGTSVPHPKTADEKILSTDELYEIISAEKKFERLLYYNNEFAWCLMDEMLMIIGYRRVLIWFITHLKLNHTVIHYIFELVMGYRCGGVNSEGKEEVNNGEEVVISLCDFSRQGTVILSEIETQMLLQEFFLNAAVTLSDRTFESNSLDSPSTVSNSGGQITEDDDSDDGYVSSYALGLVGLICTMVKSLISAKKLDITKSENTVELQTFLLNWISYLPAAKELYFEMKENVQDSPHEEPKLDNEENEDGVEQAMVGNDVNELQSDGPMLETDGKDALEVLYDFLDNKPKIPAEYLNNNTRKIIYRGDKILPLQESEKPIPFYQLFEDFQSEHDLD